MKTAALLRRHREYWRPNRGTVEPWPHPEGLMTFLVLFIAAFFVAWPIALRIAEWLIRRAGYVVETEQSGAATRRDIQGRR